MRFSVRLGVATVLLVVLACAQSTSPLDSSLAANVYTNFFFRFRYPFSASWVPEPATDQLQRESPSCLGNPTETGTSSPSRNLHNLLTLRRTFPAHGSIGQFKATEWVIAENVSADPAIVSGRECLEKLAARAPNYRLLAARDIREVKLGGTTFFRLDLAGLSPSNVPMQETAFFALTKGHALGFVLTAPNEQVMANVIASLEKVKFF